jgi:hypothetical protein
VSDRLRDLLGLGHHHLPHPHVGGLLHGGSHKPGGTGGNVGGTTGLLNYLFAP